MAVKRFHLKAALWVSAIPERRGDAVDAGCKGVFQAYWNHADFEADRDATGEECWPSAETIAGEIGSTESAVIDRRRKLVAAGWMCRDGRGWALAWMTPFGQSRSSATPVTATPVLTDTPVTVECGSSNRDSSPDRQRLESFDTMTPVQNDRDSGPTKESMIIAGSDAEEGESDACPRKPNHDSDGRLESNHAPRDRVSERKADAEENKRRSAAEIDRARASKQAAAEFDARVQPSGTAQRESTLDGVAAAIAAIPLGFWQVVMTHKATLTMAMNPREAWVKAFGEVVVGRRLTVDEFRALLDRLESQRTALGTAGYNAAVRAGTFPSIEDLWFKWGPKAAMCRAWLDENIELVQLPPGTKPALLAQSTDGMTHAAIVGSIDKWTNRHAQLAAEAALRPPEPDIDDDDEPVGWGPLAAGSPR
jgi:hypothetical protein